jgi:hypothetical protein
VQRKVENRMTQKSSPCQGILSFFFNPELRFAKVRSVLRNFGSQISNLRDFTCKVTNRCSLGPPGAGAGDGVLAMGNAEGSTRAQLAPPPPRQIRESAFFEILYKDCI